MNPGPGLLSHFPITAPACISPSSETNLSPFWWGNRIILQDATVCGKIIALKPREETQLQKNPFIFLDQITGMICGRRKYSSKYGIAMRVCNMNLVSQRKILTFVAPGQKFNPSLLHIPPSPPDLAGIPDRGLCSLSLSLYPLLCLSLMACAAVGWPLHCVCPCAALSEAS